MKLVFLASTRRDLDWFRRYYGQIFPDGEKRAGAHFKAAKAALKRHPGIGRELGFEGLREFVIPRTPFSFVYQIRDEQIEVVRLWDGRADRSGLSEQ
jgi:toxin ParE1/3/4